VRQIMAHRFSSSKNMSRFTNRQLAAGVFAACCFTGSWPMLVRWRTGHLTSSQDKLTGSQIQRGCYLNSGSIDAGPDNDWLDNVEAKRAKLAREDAEFDDGRRIRPEPVPFAPAPPRHPAVSKHDA